MTREISHQQSFEKALYSMQPNFPPGKLPGVPEFSNVYFNMSVGEGDQRGPWNKEPAFEYREAQVAVDGGDGTASVLQAEDMQLLKQAATRLQSDPESDPVTGAMLGMDNGTPMARRVTDMSAAGASLTGAKADRENTEGAVLPGDPDEIRRGAGCVVSRSGRCVDERAPSSFRR